MKRFLGLVAAVVMVMAASVAFALSLDDAEGYFDCTKKGRTIYLSAPLREVAKGDDVF